MKPITKLHIVIRTGIVCYFLFPIIVGLLLYEVHTAELRDWVKADPIALGGVPLIRLCWDLICFLGMMLWMKLFKYVIGAIRAYRELKK